MQRFMFPDICATSIFPTILHFDAKTEKKNLPFRLLLLADGRVLENICVVSRP